ncbi:hypothetical protein FRB96_002158 [Tulasnella sp. 330]|nr:hypothetical protein FRB96_002158 [Tulasnella sp. 330]
MLSFFSSNRANPAYKSTVADEYDPSEDYDAKATQPTADEPFYKYSWALPHFDPSIKLPPLEPFDHVDPGQRALTDPKPASFLDNATKVQDVTPFLGTTIEGVQLNKLSDRERDQVALFVAKRKVAVFYDQDFIDESPEWLLHNWGSYFGRLHIHPCSGQPKDYPEFHLVYRDGNNTLNFEQSDRFSTTLWHSDVTYEQQPPGITTLFLFDTPEVGGSYLETLQVVHSGFEQAAHSLAGKRGGVVKRDPVQNVHPLVRVHPVTGEKALYVNRQFSRSIVGLKTEESDGILELLYSHIEKGADFQARIRWRPRTVVLWDNRVTAHSAVVDFISKGERRHGARITPQAERPYIDSTQSK